MSERYHADNPTRSFVLKIEGIGTFDEWTMALVSRDLKDFSGRFEFSLRDATRSIDTFDYASPPPLFRVRPGPKVEIFVDGTLEMVGWIEKVTPEVTSEAATVTLSGRDVAGDLIDCACAPNGPGEYRDIKMEDAIGKIAAPFGLSVTNQIDTGAPIERYTLGVAEKALSAIEKFARQKNALVLSDGAGGIAITRTGATRAPADLTLPGNMLGSSATFSHENRFSEVTVHGQPEKARGARKGRSAGLDVSGAPARPADRTPTDGSAAEREKRGTATKGVAIDAEITRYRPTVHLSKAQPDDTSAQDEADWRSRTSRAESEELNTSVWGYGVNGLPWRTNQLAMVRDLFQGIHRDMVIARTQKTYDDNGRITELALNSPEAFDNAPVGNRRTDIKRGTSGSKAATSGALNSTARTL